MAKKIKKEEVAEDLNIQNIRELKDEYLRGKMEERKKGAFMRKLSELYQKDTIHALELDAFKLILRRERTLGKISDYYNHEILCKIEKATCDEHAEVKSDTIPLVHHLKKGMICPFYFDADTDRYVVYVDKVIPTEHQMTEAILKKLDRGHIVPEEEYPQPRIQIQRLELNSKEFENWFDVVDEDILESKTQEEFSF